MCRNCVAVEGLTSGGTVHIGWKSDAENWYDALMNGSVVLSTKDRNIQFAQDEFLEMWDTLESRGHRNIGVEDDDDPGCAICNRNLTCVPAIDGTCEKCGESKHEKIQDLWENREQVRQEIKQFEQQFGGFGPGKHGEPFEIALRAGLHCPDGHWVCSDCLMEEAQ